MAEVKSPAKVVIVDYICDQCKEGKMVCGPAVSLSSPPRYNHTCDKCGHTGLFRKAYPATEIVKDETAT